MIPEDVIADLEGAAEAFPVVHTRQYQEASAQPTWGPDGGMNRRRVHRARWRGGGGDNRRGNGGGQSCGLCGNGRRTSHDSGGP